jgi:hypothetical protein
MKKKSFKAIVAVVCGLSLMLNSCVSDLDISNLNSSIGIDQSLVMPIGTSTLTLKDILTQFKTAGIYAPTSPAKDSSEIYFTILDTVPDYNMSFKFADYTVPFSITQPVPAVPGGVIPAGSDIPITVPGNLDLGVNKGPGTQQVDSLIANYADLEVSIDASNDLKGIPPSDVTVDLDFGNRIVDSKYKKIILSFQPATWGGTKIVKLPAFILYGLTGGTSGAKTNTLPFTFNVKVKKQGFNISINHPNTFVKLNVKFKDIDYSKVYGEFDPSTLGSFNNQFAPTIETLLPNSFLSFVNPIFIIRFKSNIGSNVVLNLDSIRSLNTSTKPSWTYKYCTFGSGTKTSKTIQGPTTVGTWKADTLILDKDNGKTDMLFESEATQIAGQFLYPDWIQYKLNFSKDLSNSRKEPSYITKDARLKMEVETRIPLNFKTSSYFSLSDTIDNVSQSIGSSLDIPEKYGKEAKLIFSFKNGLPTRALVSLRLLNEKGEQINNFVYTDGKTYSADDFKGTFDPRTSKTLVQGVNFPLYLNAPKVDANGNFVNLVPQQAVVTLTNSGIKALKMTKKLIFDVTVNGKTDDGAPKDGKSTFPMHFSQKNEFSVKMGLYVKGNGSSIVSSSK